MNGFSENLRAVGQAVLVSACFWTLLSRDIHLLLTPSADFTFGIISLFVFFIFVVKICWKSTRLKGYLFGSEDEKKDYIVGSEKTNSPVDISNQKNSSVRNIIIENILSVRPSYSFVLDAAATAAVALQVRLPFQ